MQQEETVDRVIVEMLQQSLIPKIYYDEVHSYLCQVYAAGYDEGRNEMGQRNRVIQFTPWGEKVAIHESIAIAAETTEIQEKIIRRCLAGEFKTAGKFIWKYEKDAIQGSSEGGGTGS